MRLPANWNLTAYRLCAVGLYLAVSWPAWRVLRLRPEILTLSVVLAVVLIVASLIDLDRLILPDALTLPLIAVGAPVTLWVGHHSLSWWAASAAAGYAVIWCLDWLYFSLRNRHGIGMGDAKLLAASGAWLGMASLPTVLLWATGSALTASLVASAFGREFKLDLKLPFGPAIALGFWMTWLYGPLA